LKAGSCPQPWQIAISGPLFEGNPHQFGSCNPGGVYPFRAEAKDRRWGNAVPPLRWCLPGEHLPKLVTYSDPANPGVLWFALFGAAVTIGFTPVPWPDCAPAPRDKALLRATVGADVRAGRDRLTQSRVQSTTYPLKWAETPSAALTWTICSLPQHAVHPSRVAPLESRAFPESRSDLAPDGRRVSRERIRIGHTYRDKCLA